MDHATKHSLSNGSRVWRIGIIISAILLVIFLAGCLSAQEITYQNQVNKLIDRFDDLSKNLAKIVVDFKAQVKSLVSSIDATKPQDLLAQYRQLLDIYMPQLQQYLTEFQKLQSDMTDMQPPPRYTAAHAIMISGLTSVTTTLNQNIGAFELILREPELGEELDKMEENAQGFANQGIDNMEKARGMIFATNWGLIVGVIVGVFAIVAAIIIFFVYLSRRRRYQPGYPAPGPVGPYPGSGYPPPPATYRSPSEAYPPLQGDIYSAPVPQGYPPPPQPGYPPAPGAGSPPPGTPPESPPKQPVTCPRCGAEITTAGAFCPLCKAMLPGI